MARSAQDMITDVADDAAWKQLVADSDNFCTGTHAQLHQRCTTAVHSDRTLLAVLLRNSCRLLPELVRTVRDHASYLSADLRRL